MTTVEGNLQRRYESRLRGRAAKVGMRLSKSGTRNPNALDYGKYALIDVRTNMLVTPANIDQRLPHSIDLNEIEKWLNDAK